ncbi:MAG: hypothetical protein GOMPHAMPRED_007050 [Gomphillus americanus]|uniref:Uncharacterized protein n=1 Tax=Gomphillus americanus TaxID=1940652 RepID=A0A8H3ETZ0_9LECA|nr:MAG: hypothetical protein GOMPHAMPRED_007050 [Gomphillus americanus]
MVAETRGSKRKHQDVSPSASPGTASKTRVLDRQDVGVQVGSPRDDSMLEMFNMKWRDYHQEMAHIKEAMLENEAKLESQREDNERWRQLLLSSETDNAQLREKLQKAEAILKEYDIPKEKWP